MEVLSSGLWRGKAGSNICSEGPGIRDRLLMIESLRMTLCIYIYVFYDHTSYAFGM